MRNRLATVAVVLFALGAIVGTGAVASGDEAVPGVYFQPADSANGEAYAELDSDGELRIELTGLAPRATTTIDDVFEISTQNDQSRVWIDHETDAVEFYRMDTGDPIESSANAVVLSAGESVTVGIEVESATEQILLENVTVRAEIDTGSGGGGGSTPTPSPGSNSPRSPTVTPTPTPTDTSGTATPTPDPTRQTPTETSGTTETATPDPTDTAAATTATPPAETTTADGSAGNGSQPTTAGPTTAASTTAPPSGPTATGTDTPAGPGPTIETDPGDPEVGGLSLTQLGWLVAVLALLGLALLAYRLLSGSTAALVVSAPADPNLEVSPADLEHVERTNTGFAFRYAATESWAVADPDAGVTFADAMRLTNRADEAMLVGTAGTSPEGVQFLANGTDLTADRLRLAPGESATVSVAFPAGFDTEGEFGVDFDGRPPS